LRDTLGKQRGADMIRKPSSAERESKAHATVGRAMEIGGEVREASARAGRAAGMLYFKIFLGLMAFGLLTSSTPLWFKALLFALGFGVYRLIQAYRARFS
jgi:hypothetical protein